MRRRVSFAVVLCSLYPLLSPAHAGPLHRLLVPGLVRAAHPERDPLTNLSTAPVSAVKRRIDRIKAVTGREKAGYLDAYLWKKEQRSFPGEYVDYARLERAAAHRDRMPPAPRPGAGDERRLQGLGGVWQCMGPTYLTVPYRQYFGEGYLSGRVNAVAFDPHDRNIHFIATAGGGVWGSQDRGQTWVPLSDGWPFMNTSSIAMDPVNNGTIYVGTGDYDGEDGRPFGIMKSTDKGGTWTNLGRSQFGNNCVSAIVVDPDDPQIVIATTGRGPGGAGRIWRSTDGGASWNAPVTAPASYWRDLEIGAAKPDGSRYYWAVGGSPGGVVLRSASRGNNWAVMYVPQLDPSIFQELEVACSPNDPDTVYIVAPAQRLVLRNTEAGASGSWEDITSGFPHGKDNYFWSQRSYNLQLTCSFREDGGVKTDVLYLGCISIAQWVSATATWRDIGKTASKSALTHNDQHAAAFDPTDPNYLLIGNDGGVYGLTYTPSNGAINFNTNLNGTLTVTQFYAIDAHPTDPGIVLGGSQDNATPVKWTSTYPWLSQAGGDGGFAAIHPVNTDYRFGTSQNLEVHGTTINWVLQRFGVPPWGRRAFIAPIAFDPVDESKLYAGTNYLCRMNILGSGLIPNFTWTMNLGNVELAPGPNGVVTYIAVAPSDPNVIYTGASTGDVYMTKNGGTTWTRINQGLDASTTLPVGHVRCIEVHPTNPHRIYVALSGNVGPFLFRCQNTDAGASRTWNSASGVGNTALPDIHCHAVALDPWHPDSVIYAGTEVGVFVSMDNGITWSNATRPLGLPNVIVNSLKAKPSGYLYAGTYGRGIWRMPLIAGGVTVTAPNGGESYDQGSLMQVRWKYAGAYGRMNINLMRNGKVVKVIAKEAPGDGSGNGVYDWQVPYDVPIASNYRVSMTAVGNSAITDTSDADFSVTELTKLIVVSPNGGEIWKRGQPATISWIYGGNAGTHVKIELLSSGAYVRTIAETAPIGAGGSGSYSWTVPVEMNLSSSYTVRITSVQNQFLSDVNNAPFTIAESERIVVTAPNGGESLERSQPYTIRWRYYGSPGANVSIRLYKAGVLNRTIIASTPIGADGQGSFTWTVPANQATGSDYKIRVTDTSDDTVNDYSDANFTISVTWTRCRADDASGLVGQTVTLRSTLVVSGTGAPIPGKTIRYSYNLEPWGTAVTDATGAALLSFEIPDNIGVGGKAFRVEFLGDEVYGPNSGIGILTVGQAGTTTTMANVTGAIGTTVRLSAQLRRNTGLYPLPNRLIRFEQEGHLLAEVTTDDEGWAHHQIRLHEGVDLGSFPIRAAFAGETGYASSQADATLTVGKAPTALEVDNVSGQIGETVDLSAVLSRVTDGEMLGGRIIRFRVSSVDAGQAETERDGSATCPFAIPESLGFGGKTIYADFDGDEKHTASAQIATLTIAKGQTQIAVTDAVGSLGGFFDAEGRLTRLGDGAPLVGKTVVFKVNGSTIGQAVTDADGRAAVSWFVLNEYVPTAALRADFAGDVLYGAGSGEGTLSVKDVPTMMTTPDRAGTIGETVLLRGWLRRVFDSAPLQSRTLAFDVDGTEVGQSVTELTGRATLPYTVPDGPTTRQITCRFSGDVTYAPSSANAVLTASTWPTKMFGVNRDGRITSYRILKAWLYRLDNTPVVGKTIGFTLDGTWIGNDLTRSTGLAQIGYTIADGTGAGVRQIRAEWAGDGGYLPSSCSNALTVYRAIPYIWVMPRSVPRGGIARLYAYFRRLADYQKQEGKTVTFRVDGTWIADVVTLSGSEAGIARHSYPTVEPPGVHVIRCEFAGDAWVDSGYGEANLTIY